MTIDKRKIELEHPFKQAGFHLVKVRLNHDIHAELRVERCCANVTTKLSHSLQAGAYQHSPPEPHRVRIRFLMARR